MSNTAALGASIPQPFDCLANINERRFDAGNKSRPGLSQRNAPRRAREQRGAEPVLYAAHGVTDRRRAHAELSRSRRDRQVASNTSNDRQMAQEIAVHSCIAYRMRLKPSNRTLAPCASYKATDRQYDRDEQRLTQVLLNLVATP